MAELGKAAAWATAGAFTIVVIAMLFIPFSAHAHDWYTGTQAPDTGYSCCGGKDCAPLADNDVSIVEGGFYIKSKAMFVPMSRAQPSLSPDGHYHGCFLSSGKDSGGKNLPQCFFYPSSGSSNQPVGGGRTMLVSAPDHPEKIGLSSLGLDRPGHVSIARWHAGAS